MESFINNKGKSVFKNLWIRCGWERHLEKVDGELGKL